jgi:hypothetical protein
MFGYIFNDKQHPLRMLRYFKIESATLSADERPPAHILAKFGGDVDTFVRLRLANFPAKQLAKQLIAVNDGPSEIDVVSGPFNRVQRLKHLRGEFMVSGTGGKGH